MMQAMTNTTTMTAPATANLCLRKYFQASPAIVSGRVLIVSVGEIAWVAWVIRSP
jgi:hypothetical protein